MTNAETKKLALDLARADTQEEVINILKKANYWDDKKAWRVYGDNPINFSIIGNQQNAADSALVEKLVNSVDAVLMRECLKLGIEPSSSQAQQSIPEAQRAFFDIRNGKLSSIDSRQRGKLAENILLVATGSKTRPSLSIIDKGEGQSPKKIPETILSLTKNNKIKIPFVQGKFGMGGSGVLRFCRGDNKMMLIISKRSHEISPDVDRRIYNNKERAGDLWGTEDETRDLWGVSVVRREDATGGEKSTKYTYLAPKERILSFDANELMLLPGSYPEALDKPLISGTYMKLYEYELGSGLHNPIYFNLYYRLSLLIPSIALPIKMMERRKGFKANSYDKTLAGLSVRLDEDRSNNSNNLEEDFKVPHTGTIDTEGEKLAYSLYVFKKGKRENYTKNDGIIFSVNGQAQGFLPKSFFARRSVNMSYLADSILVMIDCSKISRKQQEDLFMSSRDRLTNGKMRSTIEKELENIIRNNSTLRKLANKRRAEAVANKLQDSKPLADALEQIIKGSPSLARILFPGSRISNPFDTRNVASQKEFEGKRFPTYFNPVKDYTEKKPKQCPINRRFQVQYETDAENDYFDRDEDPGMLTLKCNRQMIKNYSLSLSNGLATLVIQLPREAKIGDKLCFETAVSDINRPTPIRNQFWIRIDKRQEPIGPRPVPPHPLPIDEPPSDEAGKDRKKPSQLNIPEPIEILEEDWDKDEYKDFNFDKFSALKVRDGGEEKGYDFFINMDNVYLKHEIKINNNKIPEKILLTRYSIGMVLIGMSILNWSDSNKNNHTVENGNGNNHDEGEMDICEQISQTTQAIAPFWLPIIESLGSLAAED